MMKPGVGTPGSTGHTVVHGAGAAGEQGIAENRDSADLDERGNTRLHLGGRERLDGARVIGYRIKHAAALHHGHADAVDLGIEQVGPVSGRVHPLVVNHCGGGADGDVFFNQVKVRACLAGATGEVGFAAVAMGDGSLGGHAPAVDERRCRQSRVPLQAACAGLLPRLVCKRQQLLVGGVDVGWPRGLRIGSVGVPIKTLLQG